MVNVLMVLNIDNNGQCRALLSEVEVEGEGEIALILEEEEEEDKNNPKFDQLNPSWVA